MRYEYHTEALTLPVVKVGRRGSVLIEAGRPLPEIAARLGHGSPSVTMQVYAHWLRDDDSGSADVVPDFTNERRTG